MGILDCGRAASLEVAVAVAVGVAGGAGQGRRGRRDGGGRVSGQRGSRARAVAAGGGRHEQAAGRSSIAQARTERRAAPARAQSWEPCRAPSEVWRGGPLCDGDLGALPDIAVYEVEKAPEPFTAPSSQLGDAFRDLLTWTFSWRCP